MTPDTTHVFLLRSNERNKYQTSDTPLNNIDTAIRILYQSGILLVTSTPVDGANAVVHVKDRNKQARNVTIQNIVIKFLAENDATLFRNSFLHSCTIHGLDCTISSLYHQQEKLTAHLQIEGKARDVSIAISFLESAAKSSLSTSMRNCNGAFLNEIRNMHTFLSDDIGFKSVLYLYNRCRQLDVTEPQKKTVLDLHNKIRSLPLICESTMPKEKISK
jgi:hypothetical protein